MTTAVCARCGRAIEDSGNWICDPIYEEIVEIQTRLLNADQCPYIATPDNQHVLCPKCTGKFYQFLAGRGE